MAATTKRNTRKKNEEVKTSALEVLETTAEEKTKNVSGSSKGKMVYVACGLQHGIRYRLKTNTGAVKEIEFPGVNVQLRGKRHAGILLGAGNANCVAINEEDWNQIKKLYGTAEYFTCEPPLLYEVSSRQAFGEARDDIAEMRTGLEPIAPEQAGVELNKPEE